MVQITVILQTLQDNVISHNDSFYTLALYTQNLRTSFSITRSKGLNVVH